MGDNIKVNLKEIGLEVCVYLAQEVDRFRTFVKTVINIVVQGARYF